MKANGIFAQQFGRLDPAAPGLGLDEPFSHLIKEYEQQCRVGVCVCVWHSQLDFSL